jgi:hypothetical protein
LGSFLGTDLGKLLLKIANVQINPPQGAQKKTWMKFITTFIKTIDVPFLRLLAGSPVYQTRWRILRKDLNMWQISVKFMP